MTRTRAPRSTRRRYRWIAVLTLTVFGTVGLAGTAAAHTDLTGSDPAEGSTLTAPPAAVALTFNEPVQNFEPVVVMTGPDGQPYPTSPPVVDSAVVRTDVGGMGPAGTYTIAYRVVSVDGHPVTGQVQFQFAPTAEPTPTAPPAAGTATAGSPLTSATSAASSTSASTSTVTIGSTGPGATTSAAPSGLAVTSPDGSGSSGWVWAALIGVAVLLAAAAAVILRQRRQNANDG